VNGRILLENHPISQSSADKKSRKISHIIGERSLKKIKVKGKKIDQIFEERTDGTLEAKIEDRIPELEGENLRLSIELDPYEDIKLDL
jgi:hypothetical protein